MNRNVKTFLKEYFFITLGLLLTCSAMKLCFLPHSIAPGGVHGITIFLYTAFGLPLSLATLLINVLMTVLTFFFLGRACGIKTVYAILLMAVLVQFLPTFPAVHNPYLSAVLGAVLAAAGIALVLCQDASPGGTTVLALILQKYAHWKLEWGMLLTDGFVILAMTWITKKAETFFTSALAMCLISLLTGRLVSLQKSKHTRRNQVSDNRSI